MIRRASPADPAANIVFVHPTPTIPLPTLHPAPVPFDESRLHVDGGHELHLRQSGNPHGIAALLLHGGPGSGGSPLLARFLDPARYRAIAVDQRGAGLSRPAGETGHNTTAHLLADLHRLRGHLGIDRWLVVGGSWGATLALAHALDAPQAVAGLLLRNPFLARDADVDGFFAAAAAVRPRRWARWRRRATQAGLPLLDLLAAWIDDDSPSRRRAAVRIWWLAEQDAVGRGPRRRPARPGAARRAAAALPHPGALPAPPLLARRAAAARSRRRPAARADAAAAGPPRPRLPAGRRGGAAGAAAGGVAPALCRRRRPRSDASGDGGGDAARARRLRRAWRLLRRRGERAA